MQLKAPPPFVPPAEKPEPALVLSAPHPRRQPKTGDEWHAFANSICADIYLSSGLDQVEKIKSDNALLLDALKTADRYLAQVVSAAFADRRRCLGARA